MNKAWQNPLLSPQTLTSYLCWFRAWWPHKQLIKLDHLSLLHNCRYFTIPTEINGTIRTQHSVRTTRPGISFLNPAEQRYFAKVKQSTNTSQIMWMRCCKAPALCSSHTGTRATASVSCDPKHHTWVALSGGLVPQQTSPTTRPCTEISSLSH